MPATSRWIPRRVRPADVADAWLVHTATGDPRVDADVAAACERRRILCVNASDGAHGSARLAAETRSGDVIVGVVSDAGVDPRRAGRLRDAIGALLRDGALPVRRRRATATGRVDLVGGGPGPADLMTVRGRRLLAEADVVIADRLGPTDVLSELDPEVQVIDVGKRPGHHPVPQEEINALLVEHARAGRRVVRLKGGDPFVYGRGGEEVAACLAAGVAVEVVPGLTSVVSVPQAAGHPGHASRQRGIRPCRQRPGRDVLVDPRGARGRHRHHGRAHGRRRAPPAGRRRARLPTSPAIAPSRSSNAATRPSSAPPAPRSRARSTDAAAAGVRNPAVIVIGEVARAGLLLPDHEMAGDADR